MAITIHECSPNTDHRICIVNLYRSGITITVTVTATASVVRPWLSSTLYLYRRYLSFLVVGLGVQWTPGGRDSQAKTLQLCVGRRCLIFQFTHADSVPDHLRRFLENPSNTLVGFWNHSNWRKLEISEHELDMYRDPLDLRKYAQTDNGESLANAPVEEIVEKCLGFSVPLRRGISISDWEDDYLSHD